MKKGKTLGLLAITTALFLAGCSGSVEIGPVPTITPRPTVTPAPTPTPVVVVESGDEVKEESVYDTKKYQAYYEKENELPQLKVAFADTFDVGVELLQIDVTDAKRKEVVKSQFSQVGLKEDLSPNVIMDYEATRASGDLNRIALDFSGADVILKFAQENNLPVRGPRLITAETPNWAFTKNFDENQVVVTTDETGAEVTTIEYADAAVALARMENYIKDVISYCNTNYPGLVISWEILDDPISSGEQNENKYRSTGWYQMIGDEYLVKACECARANATTEQKLLLSQDGLDENAILTPAMKLINLLNDQKLIDGVAIQAHYSVNSPDVFNMEDMVKKIANAGLEIHFSEYHVDSNELGKADTEKTPEEMITRVTKRFKALMTNFVNYEVKKSYDVKSVTFENLSNDQSILNQPKDYVDYITLEQKYGVQVESYPLLFDAEMNVMPAFFATLLDVDLKAY